MTAQSQRLNVVASNLANAESTTSSTGGAYRAKQVVFSAVPIESGPAGELLAMVLERSAMLVGTAICYSTWLVPTPAAAMRRVNALANESADIALARTSKCFAIFGSSSASAMLFITT